MTKSQIQKAARIIAFYGRAAQLDILQEESAELIQAVSKIRRGTPGAEEHFIDEFADNCIMLMEILSDFDEDEKTELYKKINEKLDRQLLRIEQSQN